MRYWLAAIRITGVAGLLLGAGAGVLRWSPYWPGLSRLELYRACGAGWLLGALLAVPLGWLLARRKGGQAAPQAPRRHPAVIALTVVTLAPAALCVAAVVPANPLHKAFQTRAAGDTRPNLILISVDALRADYVDVYGVHTGLTPAIDAFAKEATQYDSAYVSSPWTLTSLGSLFTSRTPSQAGLKVPLKRQHDWYGRYAVLVGDVPLLSERLQHAGYQTAAELTNLMLQEERGWTRGFDWYRNETSEEDVGHELDTAARVTPPAIQWLKENRREPFFLWVHYFDVHGPYDAPTTPASLRAKFPHWSAGSRKLWDSRMKHEKPAVKALYGAYCRAMYAEEVKYVDRHIRDLLDAIRAAGLWDRSMIVITADHGEELLDHGGWEHGHSMHREVLSVPLLVKWPRGITADKRIHQTVAMPDVGATFLSLAGVPLDKGAFPPLPRRNGEKGQEVYSEGLLYGPEQTALTTDDWRVFYHPYASSPAAGFEVYDRHKDPWEHTNLASSGAAADLQARLRQLTDEAQAVAKKRYPKDPTAQPPSLLSAEEQRQLRSLGYVK